MFGLRNLMCGAKRSISPIRCIRPRRHFLLTSDIANKQRFLPEEPFRRIYNDAEEMSRMLSGLRGKLLSK